MFYRQELVDLSKDTEETRICVDIAGACLVPGPPVLVKAKQGDETLKTGDLTKD